MAERNPAAALGALQTAADLNPLSATPARLAGTDALLAGLPNEARARFLQAAQREPGGWFSWLGAGLSASVLGDTAEARRGYLIAASINSQPPAVRAALVRVGTTRPLTPSQAFDLLVIVH